MAEIILWLVLAGLFEAVREIDVWGWTDSWLYRLTWVKRWSETHFKVLFWPLDLYHCAKMASFYCLFRAITGWVDALILTAAVLASYTFFHEFALRLVPFRRLRGWLRKLVVFREDHMIP